MLDRTRRLLAGLLLPLFVVGLLSGGAAHAFHHDDGHGDGNGGEQHEDDAGCVVCWLTGVEPPGAEAPPRPPMRAVGAPASALPAPPRTAPHIRLAARAPPERDLAVVDSVNPLTR